MDRKLLRPVKSIFPANQPMLGTSYGVVAVPASHFLVLRGFPWHGAIESGVLVA
jgi:hypothetical protein